jgi:prepilin-type N-terminal cleavage/methylation domain-containing protein
VPSRSPDSGYTITELLTVIAIIGMFSAIAMPGWLTLQRHAAVRAAAEELQSVFRGARARSIASGRNVGVRFTKSGSDWMYALYDDRNGNGIKTAEINSGVDKLIARPKRVLNVVRYANIAAPSKTITDPDGDPLKPGDSPVQFGSTAICSFSPIGGATPGTIYLTDGNGEIWCARVYGTSAKVRLLRYLGGKKWVER